MAIYEQVFTIYSARVAQVLLTRADLADRRRYLNARNTLDALLHQQVVPIINENDTVATEEIRFGDNDNLSAQVANLIEADLLVLLTDQEGLYTADPRQDPAARLIRQVEPGPFSDQLWQAAGGSSTGLGTGGMVTKLQAADLARHTGTTVVIASGSEPDVLLRLAHGAEIGTRFVPTVNKLEGRKRYILSGSRAAGELEVDAGAARALARGGSLLPAGHRAGQRRLRARRYGAGGGCQCQAAGARAEQLPGRRPGPAVRPAVGRDRNHPRLHLRRRGHPPQQYDSFMN